jgi:phage gp29-like protein
MNFREIIAQPLKWLARTKDQPAISEKSRELFHAELYAVKNILYGDYFSHLSNPDEILQRKMGGLSYMGYHKMISHDSHLSSVIQTRVLAIAGLDGEVFPYISPGAKGPSAEDQKIADTTRWMLNDLDNFYKIKQGILKAYVTGFSVGEIVYDRWHEFVTIKDVKSRYPGNFQFNDDNELLFIGNNTTGEKVWPDKTIRYSFNPEYENLYGTSLCKTAYWPHWFKSTLIRYMMTFSERLGQPPIFAHVPDNWSADERTKLLNNLKHSQNDSVFVLPDGVVIDLLESQFRTEGKFRESIDFFNDEISKFVLGQTLTTGEGRRSGSLALGEVHNDVREDIEIADAADVSAAIRHQLIAPLVKHNFGYDKTVPQYRLLARGSKDLNKDATTVKILVDAGLPLLKSELYNRFEFTQPQDGDDVLLRPATPPPISPFGFTEHRHIKRVNLETIKSVDIGIVNSVYDELYDYMMQLYDSLERDLLINLQPGVPLRGLIDQLVRQHYSPEFVRKFSDRTGQVIEAAAANLARKLQVTLDRSTFEMIKNRYLVDNFYAKGRIQDMGETIRKILVDKLPDWNTVNFDVDDMRKLIKSKFADIKDWKANLIARNEVNLAAHQGMFGMIDQAGLTDQLEAYFIVDPISCDICQEWASHNPYTIEQAKSMGLPHIQCNDQWSFALKGAVNNG